MVWRVLAMTAALLAATPAMAAERPSSGKAQVNYTITPEQVAAVMRKSGFKTKILPDKHKEGEKPSWTIEGRDKQPFFMGSDVRACDADGYPKGCLGIRFYASMELDKDDLATARRTADRYNREYYIGKAYVSDDGKSLYFENYLMIDGGVTTDHIEQNLDNFLAAYDVMVEVFQELDKAVEA
jgi:hypothetical protein